MTIQGLITNWKTTSAGITMIAGSIVHLAFKIKSHAVDESAVMGAVGGIVVGIGLMLAGDASASQPKPPQNPPTP